MNNSLYYGDNLEVLRQHIRDESVDLVYLDPPFNSQQVYNTLFRSEEAAPCSAQIKAFDDTWKWDQVAAETLADLLEAGGEVAKAMECFRTLLGSNAMLAYLSMMAPRLVELRRVLKPTGSLYLHCDPGASHYLKMLLDAVFGPSRFVSELIWKRSSAHNGSKRYSPVHDTILFYAKGDRYTWNPLHQQLPQKTIDAWYNNVEEGTGRRFNRADLTASGTRKGSSGKPWRGRNPTEKGRHWAIPGFVRDLVGDLPKSTQKALDALDAMGRLHWPKKKDGMPMLKRYLEEAKGVPALDVMTDISPLNNVDAERIGYPTQKPLALLERIVTLSSDENDVVLDPFCGCGTTIHAAQRTQRRWIGIDITHLAVGVIKSRLHEAYGLEAHRDYDVIGEPTTIEGAEILAKTDTHQFEHWALGLVHARASAKGKGTDGGIDGWLDFYTGPSEDSRGRIIISVKAGKNLGVSMVRDLGHVVAREKAAIGVLVVMHKPTRNMLTEAGRAGHYTASGWGTRHRKLQILTVEELLAGKAIDAPQTKRKPDEKVA